MSRVGKIVYLLLCGLLLVGLVVGCAAPVEKPPIKVGMITDFTNPAIACYATKQREAAKMAIEEINAEGGVLGRNLELIIADDKSDTTLAISHAKRLKEQGIIALVSSSTSTELLAFAKWTEDEGQIPVIAAYGSTNALIGHQWVFRPFNDTQNAELALMLMQKLGVKKVGIEHITLAYGIGTADTTEKLASTYGIEIVGREALEFKAPDATVQAMKLRDAGAEGIVMFDYSLGVATFARALNAIDWHPPFTSSWGNIYSALAMSSPPTLMNGAIAQSVADRANPRVQKVLEDYAKYTGTEGDIDDPILLGYASVLQLVNAIKEAKTADDPVAIRDALFKVKMKDLPLARKDTVMTYTKERNWSMPLEDYTFMVVKGGKLEQLKLD